MPGSITASLLAAILSTIVVGAAGAVTLKQEPAEGALRAGQSVLVDDGTCPPGQICWSSGKSDDRIGKTCAIHVKRKALSATFRAQCR